MAIAHLVLADRRQTVPIRSHAYHLCIFRVLLALAVSSVRVVAHEGKFRMGQGKALQVDRWALGGARSKSGVSRVHHVLALAISSVRMVACEGEIRMGQGNSPQLDRCALDGARSKSHVPGVYNPMAMGTSRVVHDRVQTMRLR